MDFHRSDRRNDTRTTGQPYQTGALAPEDVEREVLRGASLVIAGCGPVGEQIAIALVQTGAEWLTLADFGRHATRQSGPLSDQLFDVNPFANVDVAQIDAKAVDMLVSRADLIIDTLDAGSSDAMRARYLLHSTAKRHQTPVLTGLDTGDAGLVIVYDYRDSAQSVLDGAVGEPEMKVKGQIENLQLLNRMIASSQEPDRPDQPLVTGCADATGGECSLRLANVIAGQLVFDMLFNRPLDRLTMIDPEVQRSATAGIKAAGQKLVAMYALRRRLRDVRRRSRPAGFSPLHDDVFKDLRPYMEERVYEAGSVIIRQGDPADDFFVLVQGRVQVEHEEHDEIAEERDDFDYEPFTSYTVIAELGPGDFFGEMALLSDAPRNASVVVTGRCVVLALSRGAFNVYLDESQPAFQRLREIALARKYENSELYGF